MEEWSAMVMQEENLIIERSNSVEIRLNKKGEICGR
jgi:hypothetical protein